MRFPKSILEGNCKALTTNSETDIMINIGKNLYLLIMDLAVYNIDEVKK